MFYVLTLKNEVKPYYTTNENNDIVVYDRDSKTGLTKLFHYKRVFTEYETNQLFPHFKDLARMHLKYAVYNYFITLWNDVPSQHYIPDYKIELLDFLDERAALLDLFAIYFREVYIFQRDIVAFNDDFLKTYRGQYANADKRILRGKM